MAKFRKKPVEIEAVQFINQNLDEIQDFVGRTLGYGRCGADTYVNIETLEGTMRAVDGDWIIKGVNGEFYPCKPDIFEKTYEEVKGRDVKPLCTPAPKPGNW